MTIQSITLTTSDVKEGLNTVCLMGCQWGVLEAGDIVTAKDIDGNFLRFLTIRSTDVKRFNRVTDLDIISNSISSDGVKNWRILFDALRDYYGSPFNQDSLVTVISFTLS